MCGISGWFLHDPSPWDEGVLARLADSLHHRGPDDRGYYLSGDARVGLAHNRLSIIDLTSAGHQPMSTADDSIVMVYNGEVYNFHELRDELAALGHTFLSRTDSEVVLHAYREWGTACVDRFHGMFALVLWDAVRSRLFLARDPMGMKPLYYTTALGGVQGFCFASELKAFLAVPGFAPRMSGRALASFMEFGYTFDAHQTALQGVRKLPPGHTLLVRDGVPDEPRPFFRPAPAPEPYRTLDLARERQRLADTLREVVAQHLVADVPVGILLSGGLDSSLVAALAARCGPVTTITMGFEGAGFDERPHARRVAGHIGSEHREVTITAGEISSSLADTVEVFDDLFDDWGAITTRLLYLKCREQGIKVVLVGEGADEIFGGYPKFEACLRLRGPRPWRLLQMWHRYGHRRFGKTMQAYFGVMGEYLRGAGGDWFHAVRMFESRRQLPNNYVMKVDKASMSVSVEARAPYLDRRVAELAYRLPREALLRADACKAILRDLASERGLLPADVLRRGKFGGSIAMTWMDEGSEIRRLAREVVLDRDAPWTDRLGLRRAMELYFAGKRDGYPFPHPLSLFRVLAWRLLQLNLWSRRYLAPRTVTPGCKT